jgi:hypothetical protein
MIPPALTPGRGFPASGGDKFDANVEARVPDGSDADFFSPIESENSAGTFTALSSQNPRASDTRPDYAQPKIQCVNQCLTERRERVATLIRSL